MGLYCIILYNLRSDFSQYRGILFYRSGFLLLLHTFSCTILSLCLKSEIMDGFWSSRCLNDPIDLPDKMRSFLSGAATPMVVKTGTKKTFHQKIQKMTKTAIRSPQIKNYRKQTPQK